MGNHGVGSDQHPLGLTALARELVERIRLSGPITFAEFMQEALYSPLGYYRSAGRIAASGDYFTSPSAHPAFGALLALQVIDLWRRGGKKEEFTIVELGAGDGLLARDFTSYAAQVDQEFADAADYMAFDRVLQPNAHYKIQSLVELPSDVYGCVLSNELLDAFPVHRFVVRDGELFELYVEIERDQLVEKPGEPSTPAIEERVGPYVNELPNGYRGEVNLGIGQWALQASDVLRAGHLITIDYGMARPELYSTTRVTGSLRCYYRHTLSQRPLARVGLQDITAHVDFTAVAEELRSTGFVQLGQIRQKDFLENLGIDRWIDEVTTLDIGLRERKANLSGMRAITNPDGMGKFIVDVHARGVEQVPTRGLGDDDAPATAGHPPLLADYPGHVDLIGGTPSASQWFEVQSFDHLFNDEP